MTAEFLLMLVARWLHILAACVALGVPIFMRLALLPALGGLDEEQRSRVRDAIAARWRMVVYLSIVVFLATGLYNFLGGHAHWRQFNRASEGDKIFLYHLLFGIKFLLAFVMFFLASALAGRSAGLASIRKNAAFWVGVLIVVGLAILGISGWLRFM